MPRGDLVLKNLLRKRRRTLLTVVGVAVSICLLAGFCATYRHIDAPLPPLPFNLVLMVTPRTSMMVRLPLHYQERIARLPGAAPVCPVNMVDGIHGG